MAEDKIQLTVQINSETGQLEVVGKKLEEVGSKAEKTGASFSGLSKEAGNLLKSFLPIATAGGIIAFFTNAVKGAEEENEALKRIGFTLSSLNVSWDINRQKVVEWSTAVQAATRFSDGEALQALDKLLRVTGSLSQAQSAAALAMNMSVASGKRLEETTSLVTDLLNGKQRALQQVNAEFGAFAGGAQNTQAALTALQSSLAGTAEMEEGLTNAAAKTKNAFGEFSDQIGQTIIPGIEFFTRAGTGLLKVIDNIGQQVAGALAIIMHSFQGVTSAVRAVMTGDFSALKSIASETLAAIQSDMLVTAQNTIDVWTSAEQAKTEAFRNGSQERLALTDFANQEQLRKFEEMELELEQRMAALGQQTHQKKVQAFDAEIQARRNKVNKEIQEEQKKQILIQKLNDFEKKGKLELARDEVLLKQQAAIQVGQLAVQTLQVVNSLGEKGSSAERARAKALLALQQALAIGWAWVNAKKAGAFGPALAAAETALIVANFAAQSRSIDKAATRESQDISDIAIAPTGPGIDLGSPAGNTGAGVGSIGGGGGGSSGGGGGGAVINVGGIVLNFSIDELSVDNIDAVMRGMIEKFRRATVESVQLALQMQRTANRNSNLAS